MGNDDEVVTVPVSFLTHLLNIRKEHYIICEAFKIPVEKRGENWVGSGIMERVRNYVTAYIGKRSIMDRETGAAFRSELKPLVSDPDPFPDEKV